LGQAVAGRVGSPLNEQKQRQRGYVAKSH
jgi:hypothetical protein